MRAEDSSLWAAVLRRDRTADGTFVYAVKSTRVYCRPSCPSRRPHRARVEFFATGDEAKRTGYRACRRCHPERVARNDGLERLQRICRAIGDAPERRWTSRALAAIGQCSAVHVRRAFQATLGLTPGAYAAFVRRQALLANLRKGSPVTSAIYESGYGSPSRAYDRDILPGMTLATYGRGGAGAAIGWTTVESPVGRILVAATERGLCFVEVGSGDRQLLVELRREFPAATIDDTPSLKLVSLAAAARHAAEGVPLEDELPVDIRGTAFQWRVWRALTRIPTGETRTYTQLARHIGAPSSARAVARACATNPIALVVPCHRVIGADGTLRGFRWGLDVKGKLLETERLTTQDQRLTRTSCRRRP